MAPAALGLSTLMSLEFVKKIETLESKKASPNMLNNFKKIEQGASLISNYEYKIKLKPNSIGHIEPCRGIPFKLRDQLQLELDKMEKTQIIEKVYEPTEWVNALVLVTKNDGSLRVCIDPHYLNQAIQREHYYIPSFEVLCSK